MDGENELDAQAAQVPASVPPVQVPPEEPAGGGEALGGGETLAGSEGSPGEVLPGDEEGPPEEVAAEQTPAETGETVRARLLAQFEQWLDAMLAEEPVPPVVEEFVAEALAQSDNADGDPASAGTDLYGLFAALTGLTGEIRLQGRAFKQLTDSIAPLGRLPGAIGELQQAQLSAAGLLEQLDARFDAEDAADTALPASKEVLGVLFDLLERLERGLGTFEAGISAIKANPPQGIFARLGGTAARYNQMLATMQGVLEGQRLTLSRLEAANQQWGFQRVGRKGEMFDPTSMTVVDVDTASSLADGTVVEVLRSGYMSHGRLLVGSQVKVAKRK